MGRTLEIWGRLSSEGALGGRAAVTMATDGDRMNQREATFQDHDKPVTKPTCHVRELGAERVVYEPQSHEVAFLNETAAWIFQRCDGSHTVAQILAAMQAEFEAPAEVLRRDLLATLAMLHGKSLLVQA